MTDFGWYLDVEPLTEDWAGSFAGEVVSPTRQAIADLAWYLINDLEDEVEVLVNDDQREVRAGARALIAWTALELLERSIRTERARLLVHALSAGLSWQELGAVIDRSRQSVHREFHGLVEDLKSSLAEDRDIDDLREGFRPSREALLYTLQRHGLAISRPSPR